MTILIVALVTTLIVIAVMITFVIAAAMIAVMIAFVIAVLTAAGAMAAAIIAATVLPLARMAQAGNVSADGMQRRITDGRCREGRHPVISMARRVDHIAG